MKLIYKETTMPDGSKVYYYRVDRLEKVSPTTIEITLGGYPDLYEALNSHTPSLNVVVPVEFTEIMVRIPDNFFEDLIKMPTWEGAEIVEAGA